MEHSDLTEQRVASAPGGLVALAVAVVLSLAAPPLGLVADLLFGRAARRSGNWLMMRVFRVLAVIAVVLIIAIVLMVSTGHLTGHGSICRGSMPC